MNYTINPVKVGQLRSAMEPDVVRIGYLWLTGLFILALGLRCVGLLWGGIDPDENIGDPARVLTGQLIPAFHYYPPLFNYVVAAGDVILYPIGIAMGLWSSTAEFRDAYFNNPDPFLVVLRLVASITGALAAPFTAMIAARLGLSRMTSLLAGVAMALLPLSVWRSHIGKADLGVAASALLAIWAMLRYAQELRRVDAIWFGVALAFAVSFKQSAIFIVGPLGLGLLLLARRGGQSWSHLAQDTLIVGVVGIIVWIPLNVGLWLDFRNFLEFQKVLAAMSMRDSGIQDTVATVWPVLSDRFMGPTLPLLLAFLVAPLWWKRLDVLVIWVAVAVSIVVTSVLSGDRTTAQLYAPQSVLVAAVGIMTCGGVAARKGWEGLAGKAGLIIAFVVLVAGAVEVERQALASPIHARVAEALLKIDDIANRRILASDVQQSGLPVSGDADRDETARNERLALKYGVTLPPRYRAFPPNAGRYYIRHMPWVMGGLEIYKDDDLKEPKPFAWPIQSEEWHLEYWLDQGYSVFVVKAEKAMLESKVDAYRRLHEEIRMRGMPVATIPIDRPLFNEADMKIYVVDPSAKSENRTESPAAEK